MLPYFVMGLNLLGTKAIIGYIVVIIVIVAVSLYMRRNNATR